MIPSFSYDFYVLPFHTNLLLDTEYTDYINN